MSLYSRRWFCVLSGSVRGRVRRDAHKARYDCLSLCVDLNKKNCVRCNRQARRDWARRACSFNVWQPSGWIIPDVLAGTDYEITEAKDGEQAFAAVAKERPDLILIDHGRLRGYAQNQGRSRDAIDSDHRRHFPCAGWGGTDSASSRM